MSQDTSLIYKPKPKKLYKSNLKISPINNLVKSTKENQHHIRRIKKKRENLNLNLKKENAKSQNFDSISLEEIENDFKNLKAQSERVQVENELLILLENSTKDTSFEEEKKSKRIARPQKIFKNFE